MIDRWLIFATLSIIWPLFWLCIFVFNLDARFLAWIRRFSVWSSIFAYRHRPILWLTGAPPQEEEKGSIKGDRR